MSDNQSTPEDSLLTTDSAAECLKVTPQRIRQLIASGDLKARRLGRDWMIRREAVEDARNIVTSAVIPPTREGSFHGKLKALSFFSGAMGLDIGLEKAGIQTILACEFDKHARSTISVNQPTIPVLGDIWKYDVDDIRSLAGLAQDEQVDVVAGGPPCQAFSTAGARRGFEDIRGNVFLHYLELAIELNPNYIIIENVRGLLSMPISPAQSNQIKEKTGLDFSGRHGAIKFVAHILETAGYLISFELYNAANFGVPQVRERVVILATRKGRPVPYLSPTHSQDEKYKLAPWLTLRDAIGDLNCKEANFIPFPEKRLKYYRLLGPGQNWRNLPVELQKEALGKSYELGGGKTGFYRRLAWDKPSATLVTHPAMPATDLGHPEEDRPLSVQEYKRIQQFPDSWNIQGNLQQQYKQIGNAVPVGLGEAIGRAIISHSSEEELPVFEDFKYSRYKITNDKVILNHAEATLF